VKIESIILPFDHSKEAYNKALKRSKISNYKFYRLIKQSLDARNKFNLKKVYTFSLEPESVQYMIKPVKKKLDIPPLIVGAGPAGLFTAYWLLQHGIHSIIIDKGDDISDRIKKMASFIKSGVLDEHSNICFGAGGAGTFSDGKLMTRIKSPYISFVFDTLVKFGADKMIRYVQNPHIGSNKLRIIITNLLSYLKENGVLIKFRTDLLDIKIKENSGSKVIKEIMTTKGEFLVDNLFLATGHSARDVYRMLRKHNVQMSFKPFAVGVRVEHPAGLIDEIQYGKFAGHPALEHADYRLAHTWKNRNNRAVYTFCMCPGGYIMNSSSENGYVVVNGMSNSRRAGNFSNASVVVNVKDEDIKGDDVFKGILFQEKLERDLCKSCNKSDSSYILPAIRLKDFMKSKLKNDLLNSSSLHPLQAVPLFNYFPEFISNSLREGFFIFNKKMKGFISDNAMVIGVESRTSSPVRIIRERDSFQSADIKGLYPVGEGAGYSGGITSSAIDGIKSANALIQELS